jgi:hypothetical protein
MYELSYHLTAYNLKIQVFPRKYSFLNCFNPLKTKRICFI